MASEPIHPSFWLDSTPVSFPGSGTIPAAAEVVVVGAGITGLTAAYLLARDGAEVLVVEASDVCSGATGFTTGKVTSQHRLVYASLLARHGPDRTRDYAAAQQSAIRMIEHTAEDESIECDIERLPAYVWSDDETSDDDLERELEVAVELELPASLVTGDIGLPWRVRRALRFDDQLVFHPRRYCLGLAQAIVARGGTIVEHTRVLDVSESDGQCRVETEAGLVTSAAVVMATQTPISERGAFFARTKPVRSYVIAAPWDDPPAGMYISAEDPVRSIRSHRSAKESVLIVGGQGHPTGREDSARGHYDELEAWAASRFAMTPVWRWSAQDFVPADGVPFVGPITAHSERVFVATGFAKWGMTNGTVAAMIISDAIAGRENPWRHAFDSTRIDPVRSASLVAGQGAATVASLIGGRIAALTAGDIESIAPGTGAVVRAGRHAAAVYRDEDGSVTAVKARCTHLGCIVRFNDAERTWDCPCHGSRFDVKGVVLDGPATDSLEPIPLEDD